MLLRNRPCKGCEYEPDYENGNCECEKLIDYKSQKKLLQKVVDDLRKRANEAKKRAIRDRELGLEQTSELESVKAVHFRDLADTYEKELK